MNIIHELIMRYSSMLAIIFLLYTIYVLSYIPFIKRQYQVNKILKKLCHIDIFYENLNIEEITLEIYEMLNDAIQNCDLEIVKNYVSDKMYEQWQTKLDWMAYSHKFASKRKSKITTCIPIGIKSSNDEIWVYVRGHHDQFFETVITPDYKKQIINKEFIEYWKLIKINDHLFLDEIYSKKQLNLKDIPCKF